MKYDPSYWSVDLRQRWSLKDEHFAASCWSINLKNVEKSRYSIETIIKRNSLIIIINSLEVNVMIFYYRRQVSFCPF